MIYLCSGIMVGYLCGIFTMHIIYKKSLCQFTNEVYSGYLEALKKIKMEEK